ncbi:MAG: T9SS type A sorting domain-containing protein, partial [bacterium]|nr:T9SS type A sorting domain-containing protein [bacterium]
GILFTRRDPADEWSGLTFSSGSGGTLEYCTFEHATRYEGNAVYCNEAEPTFEHCTFRENDFGLYARNATLSLLNCLVTDNLEYGVYLYGAADLNFGGSPAEWNDIHDNGGGLPDRDLHNGTETVYATYVYWGTIDVGEIEDLIHHEPDNASLGRVQFGPWVNAAHDTEYSDGLSAVPDDTGPVIPTVHGLDQNCPNPFNPVTTISYDLPRDSHVELVVLDLAGRRVTTLVDARQEAGTRSVTWQPRDLASGMYLYRIKTDGFEQIRKMMLLR